MACENILQDTFFSYPSLFPCLLSLTERNLIVKTCTKTKTEVLQHMELRQIIGCQSVYKKKDTDDISAYLRVYFYPLKTAGGILSKHSRRERVVLTFGMSKFDVYQENAAIVCVWRRAILWLLQGKQLLSDKDILIPASLPEERKYLIVVNPRSGPGKALTIFREQVVPMLNESETKFELLITDKQNHAKDFVKIADLSSLTGIVVVSGDGLVYEVFNGLMTREDWQTAIKTPVGVVPGGSGNGLARAINYAIGEPYDTSIVTSSVLNIVHGRSSPMDLVQLHTTGDRIYSFLSVGWGLMADIDIESEKLRAIGEARFTLWAVIRSISLRKYKGRLSYLPLVDFQSKRNIEYKTKRSQTFTVGASRDSEVDIHRSNEESIFRSKSFGETMSEIPVHNGDGSVKLLQFSYSDEFACNNVSPTLLGHTTALNGVDNGEINGHGTSKFKYQNSTAANDSVHREEEIIKAPEQHSPVRPPSILPPLDEPVPMDWTVVEGEFVLVYVCHQTHLSTDVLFAPDAKLDDGIMWLTMIKSGVSRSQVFHFLSSLETGDHVNISYVDVIPVHAFRLEPFQNEGVLTVDGEVIPCGPVQGEVLPSISRIMTR